MTIQEFDPPDMITHNGRALMQSQAKTPFLRQNTFVYTKESLPLLSIHGKTSVIVKKYNIVSLSEYSFSFYTNEEFCP